MSTRQFLMAKAMGLMPYHQTVLRGAGSLASLPDELHKNHVHHALIMTTEGMIQRGTLNEFFQKLVSIGITYSTFTQIQPNPTDIDVANAAHAYVLNKCDVGVAIGGGSVIDCAKVALAKITNPQLDVNHPTMLRKPLPLFAAVPTTAGSGSEITAGAVITHTNADVHVKSSFNDVRLVPHIVVLDPALTISLPTVVTRTSGIDALSHAIEAATNKYASHRTRTASDKALSLLLPSLSRVLIHPKDIQLRVAMLEGAYQAGLAITTNFVGNVHALSHAIGSRYDIAHGAINAVLLVPVLKEYGASVARTMKHWETIFAAELNGQSFVEFLDGYIDTLGVNRTLELNSHDFLAIATQAREEALGYPVPQEWNIDTYLRILREVTR
ncbi:iron-containing alcohol dehydrogenase [Alloscardovia venturai]|uniref:Iron-containing alcohol dehydrogenase n=1 Tax=Alloscardovia venturai TaxID=1769421 RepID=A0ABW2Y416_9BIFI